MLGTGPRATFTWCNSTSPSMARWNQSGFTVRSRLSPPAIRIWRRDSAVSSNSLYSSFQQNRRWVGAMST
ncbi:Uncharacterised protein [Mycobacteroides abscessus subsp. abscessus]|nr:Uncharacterised protein [Mycobacteroides abscessus subsp. abscessus]